MGKSIILPLVAISIVACQTEHIDHESDMGMERQIRSKMVRLSEDYDDRALLVKLEKASQSSFLSESEEISEVTPVFRHCEANADLEKRFGLDRWFIVKLNDGCNIDAFAEELAAYGHVSLVEFNSVSEKCSSDAACSMDRDICSTATVLNDGFNDPMLNIQWNYDNQGNKSVSPTCQKGADVNVKNVWKYLCAGDPSIVVAVVDEGVKYNHPDLKDNMWVNKGEIAGNQIDDDGNGYVDDVNGYNFVDDGNISWALPGDSGHGTHCAGTIAAVNNNGMGVCGVAGGSGKGDGCKIMSCQIFSGDYGGSAIQVANAIKYAADNGASVISCSFGYTNSFSSDNYYQSRYSIEIDAIHYFEACSNNNVLNGNVAIFAAGNNGHNYAHYPGAFHDIISVSAFGPDLLPTYYTNYGPGCNISAPGGEAYHTSSNFKSMILSTMPSEIRSTGESAMGNYDYAYMQGTSMACPHVSGVVALGLSYAKKLGKTFDRDQFKQMILSSVNDIDQRIGSTSSKTYAYHQNDLQMGPYYHQMGTGAIDAWRLMMHIEGTPCLTAQVGTKQWLDISEYLGSASVSLTFLGVEVPEATVEALGLQPVEGEMAYIRYGRLYIHPSKIGSGKIYIKSVGGGSHLGGGDNPPGGMEIDTGISIVARDIDGANGTGGWL